MMGEILQLIESGKIATAPFTAEASWKEALKEGGLLDSLASGKTASRTRSIPTLEIIEYLIPIEALMDTLAEDEAEVKKFTERAKWAARAQIGLGATALGLGIALCFVTVGAAVPVLIVGSQVAGWTAAASSAYGDANRGKRKKKEGRSNRVEIEEELDDSLELIDLDTGFGVVQGTVKIVTTEVFAHGLDSDSGTKAGVDAGSKMGMGYGGNRTVLSIVETAGTGTATLSQVGFGMSAAGSFVSVCLGARNLKREGNYNSTIVYMACQKELKQHLKTLELLVAQLKDKKFADFFAVFVIHFPMKSIVERIGNLSNMMTDLIHDDRSR